MDEWFFANNGAQEGPVTAPQLQALVRSGALESATLLVWKEGMAEWSSLHDAGLMPATSPLMAPAPMVASTPPASLTTNPYLLSERGQQAITRERDAYVPSYEGYGRLRYFLTSMIMTIVFYGIMLGVVYLIMKSTESVGFSLAVFGLLGIVFMIATLYVGSQRTKNLGMSGFAVLWSFVPIMNIWIGWRMMACPEGYEDHRTLDVPGKVLSGIWIALMVLAIGSSLVSQHKAYSSERRSAVGAPRAIFAE